MHRALYFGLEAKRSDHGAGLIAAMRASATGPFTASDWSRIVDYRYSMQPLSVAGSLQSIGGRFNIGRDLDPGHATPFPALYVAQNEATAYLERFGTLKPRLAGNWQPHELALRTSASYSHLRLRLHLELILDIRRDDALSAFVAIIRNFPMPEEVTKSARALGLKQKPWLIRTAASLRRQLVHTEWRSLPMQFSIPSNPQVFGRIAAAAGLHGIIYPSSRNSQSTCLALFPQNWKGTNNYVELEDASPVGTRLTRLDAHTPALE
jgi:RES domain-containing protein